MSNLELQRELIHNSDWRIIVILDACRYDYFREVYRQYYNGWDELDSILKPVWSPGHQTADWYNRTWFGRLLKKTVLISASPVPFHGWTNNIASKFKKAVLCPVTRANKNRMGLPSVESIIDIAREYLKPKQNMLIHLTPPHLPFIGPEGSDFLINQLEYKIHKPNPDVYRHVEEYGRLHKNGFKTLRKFYMESIKTALDIILKSWLSEVNYYHASCVITSDHGELIGEGGYYRHSGVDVNDPVLRTVPWLVLP